MSAMGGSVPVRPSAEIDSGDGNRERLGGIVVSLRNEQPRVTQPASLAPGLGPISPELALVDPELGRAARELLPDLPRATPIGTRTAVTVVSEQPARAEQLQGSLERIPHLVPRRRRVSLGRLLPAVALVALGMLLTLFVGRETGSPPPQPQPQSVPGPLYRRRLLPASHLIAPRPRLPRTPRPRRRPPFRRSLRSPPAFMPPRCRAKPSSGSRRRRRLPTSSSCFKPASASSERASTNRGSNSRAGGGKEAVPTHCCRGTTAGTCGPSRPAPSTSRALRSCRRNRDRRKTTVIPDPNLIQVHSRA